MTPEQKKRLRSRKEYAERKRLAFNLEQLEVIREALSIVESHGMPKRMWTTATAINSIIDERVKKETDK